MGRVVQAVIIALAGGYIGIKLKIPAGALLGSMTAVGLAGIFGARLEIPQSFNVTAQMIIGGFLGLSLNREVIEGIKGYILPSILVVVMLSVLGVLTGVAVHKITGVELYTALFGSVPGGMQEMVVLSQSYDVNHPAVVVIQTVRRVLIVILYPLFVAIFAKITANVQQIMGK